MYECTEQAFHHDLIERVLKRREDQRVVYSGPLHCRQPCKRKILHNIAPFPKPGKADLPTRCMNTDVLLVVLLLLLEIMEMYSVQRQSF